MTYEVLARKWRPSTFAAMAGQEHVLRALINALTADRLHHAYLFTGTRGVGKTTVARILAKCLNCETGVTAEPCGVCSSCTEISEGRFVDLIEVDAASRSRVEETRDLLENVQYAPTRGRYKVYLIDEVHMLSTASFNALLKTLEEPPPHVKFLLATTDPKKLPVTVLSRCLQFHLKNLTPERIVRHLEMVLGEEGIEAESEALWALARAADGSMRDGLSLTDQAIAFGDGRLAADEVARMLGTIDQSAMQRILEGLAAGDGELLLAVCADLAEHAADFPAVLRELMAVLHRIAVIQAVPAAAPPEAGSGDRSAATVVAMAGPLAPEDIQLYYQIALMGQRDLPFAPDPRSGFEMTLLRMLAFRPEQPGDSDGESAKPVAAQARPAIPAAPAETAAAEARTGGNAFADDGPVAVELEPVACVEVVSTQDEVDVGDGGLPRDAPATRAEATVHAIVTAQRQPQPQPETEPEFDTKPEPELAESLPASAAVLEVPELTEPQHWHEMVSRLELSGLTSELVNHCMPVEVEADRVRLLLDPSAEALNSEVHIGRLEVALGSLLRRRLRVEILVGAAADENPAQRAARQRAERQRRAEEAIASDANVQMLIETFNASVQRESIRPMG